MVALCLTYQYGDTVLYFSGLESEKLHTESEVQVFDVFLPFNYAVEKLFQWKI
jgi:hypothetical protein